MRTLLVMVALATQCMIYAQKNSSEAVLIQYDMFLSPTEERMNSQEASPNMARMFTPLFPPERKVFTDAFLNYAQRMGTVKNYYDLASLPSPRSLAAYSPSKGLNELASGNVRKLSGYYITAGKTVKSLQWTATGLKGEVPMELDAESGFFLKDTSYTENLETGEMVPVVVTLDWSVDKDLTMAGFLETWDFDSDKAIFSKNPVFLTASFPYRDELTGDFRGAKPFFVFEAGKFSRKMISNENLVRKDVETEVLFDRGSEINRANECDEAIDQNVDPTVSGYIEPVKRSELLLSIFKSIKEGQAKVFDYDGFSTNVAAFKPLSRDVFFDRLQRSDTVYVEDLESGEMVQVIVSLEQHLSDVIGFRFFEDWYMDSKNMSMYKRVTGVALLTYKRSQITGEIVGVQPLCNAYVKLNTKW